MLQMHLPTSMFRRMLELVQISHVHLGVHQDCQHLQHMRIVDMFYNIH